MRSDSAATLAPRRRRPRRDPLAGQPPRWSRPPLWPMLKPASPPVAVSYPSDTKGLCRSWPSEAAATPSTVSGTGVGGGAGLVLCRLALQLSMSIFNNPKMKTRAHLHTLAHTRTRSHSHAHTRTHSHTLALTRTHPDTPGQTHTHSHALTHPHTLTNGMNSTHE